MKTTELFKIKQDGFKEIRKAMLIKSIPISLFAAFGGLAISHFNSGGQSDVNVFPFVIPIVLGALAFGLYRGINRQKEIFDSYRLTLDNNGITREQHNTPTITILKTDISEIVQNSNGSFTIKGNSTVNVIGVPSQIEDYEKLEKLLNKIKQFSKKTSEPFLQKYRGVLSILTTGLMAAVYISKDKIIVGVCGTVLLILMGYSFFEIQRSKNIDSKTKKGMWWLIVVTASIIGVMYFKLFTTTSECNSLFESGMAKYDAGDYPGAVADYEKAIKLDPKFARAFYKIGYTYSAMGEYEKSIEYCSKAIEIDKMYSLAYIERAFSKNNIGDNEGALEDCTNAISIDRNNEVAYVNRALAKNALESFESAIADCDSALIINPNYSIAFVNRGYAKDALGQLDEAIDDYEKAILIAPNEKFAYNNIGHTLNSKLKFTEAKKYLDKAIELSSNYMDAYYNRGESNWALNDSVAACKDWNQAYDLGDSGALNKIEAHCE